MSQQILKVYGAYSLQYRRYDGEWTIKRLSAQTHSEALANDILNAIEALPLKDRTKEAVAALAQERFDKSQT